MQTIQIEWDVKRLSDRNTQINPSHDQHEQGICSINAIEMQFAVAAVL